MANLAPLFDLNVLLPVLEASGNSLVLAANRRLAAKINQSFQHYATQTNSTTLPPKVLAINDFLLEQYHRFVLEGEFSPRSIMSATTEKLLWKEAIASNWSEETALLKVDSAAQTAASAYQLALQYRLTDDALNPYLVTWRDSFIQRSEQLNSIDQAKLQAMTIDALLQQKPLAGCLFVGFESLSLLFQLLFQHWHAQHVEFPSKVKQQMLHVYSDINAELEAAIDDGVNYLETHPAGRFAIVDPLLSKRRDDIERLLLKRLDVQSQDVFSPRDIPKANISAGQRAIDQPLLAIIPDLMQLWLEQLDIETLYGICHTPFIVGGDGECFERSRFYTSVVAMGRPENSQAFLREQLQSQCPKLWQAWHEASDHALRHKLHRSSLNIAAWCTHLEKLLGIFGWPGERETDSLEFQQMTLWQNLLADLRQTPEDISINIFDFISVLKERLSLSIFQAKVEDCGLQILGSLEAANLNFDRLWILSMSDGHFPGKAKPNPLIALDIQRALDMPHCDAKRELRYAESLLHSYRASAESIVYSYTKFDGDIEVRPSPLLSTIDIVEPVDNAIELKTLSLECIEDEFAPAVEDAAAVSGGSSVLSDQAQCPFRAFATHRLGLQRVDPVTYAMPAHVRGTAVHEALEILLPKGLLQSHIDQHSDETISKAIDAALQAMYRKRSDIMHPRYQEMEAKRLSELLLAWLDIEKQRPPFRIIASEEPRKANFSGLELNLRIDRIDEIDAHRLMVIDYKTGTASINSWHDERPGDPQLLLYALLLDDGRVEALAKAGLKRDEMKYAGLSGQPTGISGIKALPGVEDADPQTIWADQKIRWHQRLEHLAAEFLQGDAQVLPTSSASCQYCHLHDVCRIGERR